MLRRHRHELGEKLTETADRAGVSSQYLSELERGRKDASSELLAAVAGALGLSLLDLTREVGDELARRSPVTLHNLRAVRTSTLPVAPMRDVRGPFALAG